MRILILIFVVLVILPIFYTIPVVADLGSTTMINVKVIDQNMNPKVTKAPPIYGNIQQGEVVSYRYYVPSEHSALETSLQWDHSTNNDLTLTLYPPNEPPLLWDDADDGQVNGEISLRTSLPPHLTGTYWDFDITGRRVSGTQSYTFFINTHT